jgi:putative Ca2+/H+ antiporter (TMEM165/GDT1 family)
MDTKLVLTTFVTVFLAELGDKTQLATLSFATSGSSRLSVFVGSAAALVLASALAVAVGEGVSRLISPRLLMRFAGLLFFVVGGWVLWSSRA